MPKAEVSSVGFPLPRSLTLSQSKSGELFNNFVSGAIGGAVGTMINTPCAFLRGMILENSLTSYTVDVVKSRIQMHSTGEWYVQCALLVFSTDSLLQDIPCTCTGCARGRSWRIVQGCASSFQYARMADHHLLSGFAPKVLRLAPGGGVLLLGTSIPV
jgi:solute carrier family 25 2-oxodicarboxylate transporter 21